MAKAHIIIIIICKAQDLSRMKSDIYYIPSSKYICIKEKFCPLKRLTPAPSKATSAHEIMQKSYWVLNSLKNCSFGFFKWFCFSNLSEFSKRI